MDFYIRKTEEGQSIWDIAIQEYGDCMQAWVILQDNPGTITDLNDILSPGTDLNIRVEHTAGDVELMKHFRDQQILINCHS